MKYLALVASFICANLYADQGNLNVCVNYHCEVRQAVNMRSIEWEKILSPFSADATSARDERQKISQAIALFEQYMGLHVGTHSDQAGNDGDDKVGQLDCISESLNTQGYLMLLETSGRLRWHTVKARINRSSFLFDEHWAAVIEEKQSGVQYAVDSWFYANGEAPAIQPLGQWLNKRPIDNTLIP